MDKEVNQPVETSNRRHSVLRRASMFLSRSQSKVQANAPAPVFVNQNARMKAIALISASNYATNKTAEVAVQGVKTINMYAHTEHQVIQQLQENHSSNTKSTTAAPAKQDWQKMIVKKKKPKQQPAGSKPSAEPEQLGLE